MITVDELAQTEELGVSFLAGREGGQRSITWAHVCDLPDPWRWVNAGDLVMTTGGGLPAGSTEQVTWLNRVAEVGVSGLVLALRPGCPPVTPDLLCRADERGLPLLRADFDIQFIELARAVIENTIRDERDRVGSTLRVYDAHAQAVRDGLGLEQRFANVARAAGCKAWVLDAATGTVLVRSDTKRDLPGTSESVVTSLNLPTRPPAILLIAPLGSVPTNAVACQHLASLVTLELAQQASDRDRHRVTGSELLAALVDGDLDLGAAWPELRSRGLSDGAVMAICNARDSSVLPHHDLHHMPQLREFGPLLLHRGQLLFAVLPNDSPVLSMLAAALGDEVLLGVSDPLGPNGDLRGASRQANLARLQALEEGRQIVRYGDADRSASLLPRSLSECTALVEAILGPLISYDAKRDSELVNTLRTFLTLDRSPQRTADALTIHRQTLVYRLGRIQTLTGRTTSRSSDVAAFWLAFEAGARAGLPLGSP